MKPYAERGTTQRLVEAEALIATLAGLGDLTAPENAAPLRELQPRIQALHEGFIAGKQRGGSPGAAAAIQTANQAALTAYYTRMKPIVAQLMKEGISTYGRIAETLNARNVPSYSGKPWKLGMAFKLIKGLEEQAQQEKQAA